MKAIVTGANGLVGANLVRELLRAGHEVRAFVRQKSDRRSLDGLEVETVFGDVLDTESLKTAAQGCDVLFHAAAVFSYWNHTAEILKKIAVQGTLNTVNAANDAGIGRVVLTSSTVVLGSGSEHLARDESSPSNETDAYAAAKVAQEEVGFARAAQLGVELVAACPSMCLGAHDYRLSPSNAIICSYLKDPWKLTWPGGCNLVSVRDVARGHLLLAEKGVPGERYILGSENLEWPAIHQLIAELCGTSPSKYTANHTFSYLAATAQEFVSWLTRKPPLSTRTQAKMVGRYYWYNYAHAAALGYSPRPSRDALAEAIAWLLTTPHIPMTLRSELKPRGEVYAAWEILRATEERLRKGKATARSQKGIS
jgi:dihydroflavonol-4-reductase